MHVGVKCIHALCDTAHTHAHAHAHAPKHKAEEKEIESAVRLYVSSCNAIT